VTGPKAKSAPSGTAREVEAEEKVTMEQLLCDIPLHSLQTIPSLFSQPQFGSVRFPDEIRVHCDHERCGGERRHVRVEDSGHFKVGNTFYVTTAYVCTNCRSAVKVFGLKAERYDSTQRKGHCTKIYQEPAFGEPIPKRFFEVIGEENREPFLQARRAIARGLGIGAYAYYRRIIENTKFALVDSVLGVARATNAPSEQIELLEKAHNPLTLLHDLLSEGIHELDDEECLARAQEAEVILCEIANRMQNALTERKAVKDALSSIFNRKAKQDAPAKTSGT
jgi:hypothetical protein